MGKFVFLKVGMLELAYSCFDTKLFPHKSFWYKFIQSSRK